MGKYTLKQQPGTAQDGNSWIQNRYKPPQAPSLFDRLTGCLKPVVTGLVLIVILLGLAFAIPFRKWDQQFERRALHAALTRLWERPDSREALADLYALAQASQTRRKESLRSRPDKWHQALKRQHFDVDFGMFQTLGVGLVQAGSREKGLGVLTGLYNRTDLTSVSGFSNLKCSSCQHGHHEETCTACKGNGYITRFKKNFPLNATLKNTRPNVRATSDNESSQQDTCKSCKGTGKVNIRCPACSGYRFLLPSECIPNLFLDTLNATVEAVERHKALWRFIEIASRLQGGVAKKGKQTLGQTGELFDGSRVLPLLFPQHSGTEIDNVGAVASSSEPPPSASPQPSEADAFLSALQDACEEKLRSGSEEPDFHRILAEAAKSHRDPKIQCCAMSVFGLGLLLQRETNQYSRVADIQKRKFAGSDYVMSVSEKDYLIPCRECNGAGRKMMPCPMCTGPKSCAACQGSGWLKAGDSKVRCEACRHRPPCAMCKGTAKIMAVCPECHGDQKSVQVTREVKDAYLCALSNLIGQCESLLTIQQESRCEVPLEKAADATTEVAAAPLPAAVTKNGSQILNEPGTLARSIDQSRSKWKSGHWVFAVFLVGSAVLAILRIKRKAAPRVSTLPGMSRMDTSAFTDPLSLTAEDSRARVKRETVRIPLGDADKAR